MHTGLPTLEELITLVQVALISGWGGLAAFIKRKKAGEYKDESASSQVLFLLGDFVVCILAGYIAYNACLYFEVKEELMVIAIALAGWSGPETVDLASLWYRKKILSLVENEKKARGE